MKYKKGSQVRCSVKLLSKKYCGKHVQDELHKLAPYDLTCNPKLALLKDYLTLIIVFLQNAGM